MKERNKRKRGDRDRKIEIEEMGEAGIESEK